jgi:hypothetical protein
VIACHCVSHQPEIAHTRRGHPETSHEAAASLSSDALSELQTRVLEWFQANGPATDETLLRAEEFNELGASTARSRRATLVERGFIRDSGRREVNSRGRNMIVWEVV